MINYLENNHWFDWSQLSTDWCRLVCVCDYLALIEWNMHETKARHSIRRKEITVKSIYRLNSRFQYQINSWVDRNITNRMFRVHLNRFQKSLVHCWRNNSRNDRLSVQLCGYATKQHRNYRLSHTAIMRIQYPMAMIMLVLFIPAGSVLTSNENIILFFINFFYSETLSWRYHVDTPIVRHNWIENDHHLLLLEVVNVSHTHAKAK